MAVAAAGIVIEEIREVEFTDAKLDPASRERSRKAHRPSLARDAFAAERDDLVQNQARQIGRFGKLNALYGSNVIEVGDAGHTNSVADAAAAGVLHIRKNFRRVRKLETGVQRNDVGRSALGWGRHAVRPAVLGGERRVPLEYDVGLSRNPVAVRF